MTQNIKPHTFKHIEPLIKFDLDTGTTPMLLGEAGIGKSSFLKDFARSKYQSEIFTLSLNIFSERADLTGARVVQLPSGDWTQIFIANNVVKQCIAYAKTHETAFLFLDEFNRADSSITSAVFQLITERKLGEDNLPDNVKIVIAGNDVGNVVAVDSASVSRTSVYKIKPDLKTFKEHNETLHPFIKHWLDEYPEDLLSLPTSDDYFDEDDLFEQITTPRTITGLNKIFNLNKLTTDYIMKNNWWRIEENETESIIETLIYSHIGYTDASQHLIETMQNLSVSDNQLEQPTNTTSVQPNASNVTNVSTDTVNDATVITKDATEYAKTILTSGYTSNIKIALLTENAESLAQIAQYLYNNISDNETHQFQKLTYVLQVLIQKYDENEDQNLIITRMTNMILNYDGTNPHAKFNQAIYASIGPQGNNKIANAIKTAIEIQ